MPPDLTGFLFFKFLFLITCVRACMRSCVLCGFVHWYNCTGRPEEDIGPPWSCVKESCQPPGVNAGH